MLSELKVIGEWYKEEPEVAWDFNEVFFTDEVCDNLSKLGLDIEFHSFSAKVKGKSNHCYVPSQYFLYAIKVKPLALLLQRYVELFNTLREKFTSEELVEYIEAIGGGEHDTDSLDVYSRDNFFKVFNHSKERLDAKSIFNKKKSSVTVRSASDFFSSIILKILPVPDASSGILGRVIYELSNHPDIYDSLEKSYSKYIPTLISAKSGDEILQRLFFIISIKDNLHYLLRGLTSERVVSVEGLKDIFLLTTTPIAGNKSYFEKPITYLPCCSKFVHLRKGLIECEDGLAAVNFLLAGNNYNLKVKKVSSGYFIRDSFIINDKERVKGAENKIYYGAPGTGKSYQIDKIIENKTAIRTVFHPDTQYSDFVGCIKPVMSNGSINYGFRAGPFTEAIVHATNNPDSMLYLVIEEINRAPAAAAFGEIFQLLDRDPDGYSSYFIDVSDPDMLAYINEKTDGAFISGKLKIPSNLSLLATMNSSDQAVMPLDTAFKRRWSFVYLPIDYSKASEGLLSIPTKSGRTINVKWASFAEVINKILVTQHIPEDRLLGHRFISEIELTSDACNALKEKIFMYLWDDVLRHGRQGLIFSHISESGTLATFGQLVKAYEEGDTVFNDEVESELVKFDVTVLSKEENNEQPY